MSFHRSSRKESLTTAATGQGRAGGDGGTTNAVPSRHSGPPGAAQPPRPGASPHPAAAGAAC